jgi:polysaccharide export outer membrane protein
MAAGIATAGALVLAMWLATTVSVSAQDRGLGEYRLAPDDRLSIVVFGQTELSGDFAVDGAGRIVLPIVGQVSVGELTVAEAQERIQRSFADGVLVQPTVAVRIAEYRPVFIVGDVRTPGSYPFRFGQFVKTAIAMAGGHGRPTDQQNVAMSDFISSQAARCAAAAAAAARGRDQGLERARGQATPTAGICEGARRGGRRAREGR